MDGTLFAILIVGLIALVPAGGYFYLTQHRSSRLRDQFGPEYERMMRSGGNRREAEKELEERAERVEKLHLKELSPESRRRYAEEWRMTQSRFVDDPSGTLIEAHDLVQRVMRERGYPPADFVRQGADISVDHPDVVGNYRAAHAIVITNATGDATTEDLRQAMIHYRALFSQLLGEVPVGA